MKQRTPCLGLRRVAAAAALAATGGAHAAAIPTDDPDLALRWDTTVKLSEAMRVKSADPVLLSNPNDDDGDRNFAKGLISNRVDLFTEFDAVYQKRLGLRFSGEAWYDAVYNRRNDNPGFQGGAFPNQTSVAADQFTTATRNLMGRKAQLLDAFAFAKFDLGEMSGSVRAGRHAILWGESLFFGVNAISGGQQPVDAIKLAAVPGTQFKEAILPVPQVSGQLQLTPTVTVGAYVQTAFEPAWVPAVGSYFSNNDLGIVGAEGILLGPGAYAPRQDDRRPSGRGQAGIELKLRGDEADYGFYVLRYDNKVPQLVPLIGLTPVGPAPVGYYLGYQKGITAYAFSVSRTFGDFNVAVEAGLHHNQDLASTQSVDLSSFTPAPPTDIAGNPAYAVGRTAHVNVSTIASLGPSWLWKEATLAAELAWNRVLTITRNAAARDPNATRDGSALRFVLEPTYRQVFDGVDIGVPVGAGYAPTGSRPLAINNPNAWVPQGGGDVSIGLNGSYHDAWRATVAYTHYLGTAATYTGGANNAFSWQQTLKDRDFIAVSLRYSF